MRVYIGTSQLRRIINVDKTGIVEQAERHWVFIPENEDEARLLVDLTKDVMMVED